MTSNLSVPLSPVGDGVDVLDADYVSVPPARSAACLAERPRQMVALARKPAASVEKLAGVRLVVRPGLAPVSPAQCPQPRLPEVTSPVFGSQTPQLDTRSSVLTPTWPDLRPRPKRQPSEAGPPWFSSRNANRPEPLHNCHTPSCRPERPRFPEAEGHGNGPIARGGNGHVGAKEANRNSAPHSESECRNPPRTAASVRCLIATGEGASSGRGRRRPLEHGGGRRTDV